MIIAASKWLRAIGCIILTAMLAAGWGCKSNPDKPPMVVNPKPTPKIPAPPRLVAVPRDPKLIKQAQDELLADASGKDAELRANAVEALANVAPDLAAPAVLAALSDSEPAVRFSACMAAGQLRLKTAYPPLLAMMHDTDRRVQVAQRYALHKLGDMRFSHDFERFAVDPDANVRGSVAQTLGLLGEPSAVKLLEPLSQDKAASVRLQASEALWRLGQDAGFTDLIAYTISQAADEQIIALLALAAHNDPRVTDYIRAQLTNDYVEISLVAVRVMGMIGSDEGYTLAAKYATSNDAGQRSLAALAMGAIARSDLQSKLRPMLNDPSATVRLSAATAILQLKTP